jgi:hypothetical protein
VDANVQIQIVSTLGTLGLAVISIFGAIINNKLNKAEKDRAVAKSTTDNTLTEIKHLANSNLTATNERLDRANEQIKHLYEVITAEKEKSKQELVSELRTPTAVPVAQVVQEVAAATKDK